MSKTMSYVKPIHVMVGLALVLSVGITALPMAGTVATTCAQNVWVDDDADPGWYDETHVHTIQEGVDAVCEAGTVYVLPGTYPGGTTVNEARVTIMSTDGPETTIVQDTGAYGCSISNKDVTIDGFKITGFGGGMSPTKGTGHSPQINYNYSGYGIHLFCGANNCIMKNNIIENNRHGIGIQTDNNQILLNNILNNVGEEPSGIHIGSYASGN